jgi:hypothetical protein
MMLRLSLLILFLLLTVRSQAHSIFQNPLWVEYTEQEITVRVHVSAKEICTAAGLPFDATAPLDQEQLTEAAPKHWDYFKTHLRISVDSQEATGELVKVEPPTSWLPTPVDKNEVAPTVDDTPDRIHFTFHLRYPCTSPPQRITLTQNMMAEFSYMPGTPFNFSYVPRIGRAGQPAKDFGMLPAQGTFDVATDFAPPVTAATAASTPAPRSIWSSAREFMRGGIHHVLTGYDHLLFAAALVLALRNFWEVFKIIGLFTLAHSITVGLSAYQLVYVPQRVVEPLIAGSIVFVALENLLAPQQARSRWRYLWTFAFGLVHGLGLAGALVENLEGFSVGLIAMAVVAFCVGVEIGHLCIVGPLSLLMSVGREKGGEIFSARALRFGSIFVALAGVYYLVNALGYLPENLTPEALLGGS